jgi:cytochrome c nitrite reductase small subunit
MRRRRIWIILGAVAVVIIVAGVAAWEYHEQPQFCGLCHIMDPYLASWESSNLLAEAHADADVNCLECHEPTVQQQVEELVKFVKDDYQDPLVERKFDKQWCFRCHEHGSYEQVVQLTSDLDPNPHDSYHGELECNVCHKVHRESEDYCAQCHASVVTASGWTTATQVLEWWTPEVDCAYCHQSYTASPEDVTLLANVHAQKGLGCLDCHDPAELQPLHAQATTDTSALAMREYPDQFCFDCHVPNIHPNYQVITMLTSVYTVGDLQVNPHDPHAGSETLKDQKYECYRCHTMHSESQGINYCYTCHKDEILTSCNGCDE